MDEQRSKAVTECFVRLYKEGLIYRFVKSALFFEAIEFPLEKKSTWKQEHKKSRSSTLLPYHLLCWLKAHVNLGRDVRLVNWDCVLKTAVSDVEVSQQLLDYG